MAAPLSRRTFAAVLAIASFGLVAEATQVESVSAESSTREQAAPSAVPAECGVPVRFAAAFRTASRVTSLPLSLLVAVAWEESRMDPNAASSAGAHGLFQLMPGTAKLVAVDGDGPAANIRAGARYLRLMLERFDGDLELALSAYNAGPTAVEQAGGAPSIGALRYALNVEAHAASLTACR